MNKPLKIIDEYHDHPRPGYMVPVWSWEQGGYFIQVPPIDPNAEEPAFESRWSKQDIFSYFGVPAEMLKSIKANERENEEMYMEWLKSNPAFLIGVDLANKTDRTVYRKPT